MTEAGGMSDLASQAAEDVETGATAALKPGRKKRFGLSDIKLNAVALYFNFIALAIIGLAINPVLVRLLGQEQFGIWKAALRLLDLTSVADGRATQALKWVVAHGDTAEEVEHRQRAIGASLLIWFIWLPLLLAGMSAVVFFLPDLINGIAPKTLPLARIAVAILGANMVLTAFLGIPDAVLVGTNQGWRSYFMTTTFLVLSNIGMVAAAYLGFGLIGITISALACSILNGFCTYLVARRRIKWWGMKWPSKAELREMLSFSNLTLLWQLVQVFMLTTDVLLIGYFSGAHTVSKYTFFGYAGQFALSICLMTGSAAAPRVGALIGARDFSKAAALLTQTRGILLCIITTLAGGILLCNQAFIEIWVGPQYYLGGPANIMMIAVIIQLALLRFDAQVQDLGLKIGKKVMWGAICALVSFAVGAGLYRLTGSISMMFVGIFVGRLPLSFIFSNLARRLVPGAGGGYKAYLLMLALLGAAAALSLVWAPHGVIMLGLTGMAAVVVFFGLMGLVTLPRELMRQYVGKIAGRRGLING